MKNRTLFLLLVTTILVFGSCASRRTTLQHPNYGKNKTGHIQTPTPGGTSTTGLSYIERYKDIAIAEMNQYGIPASIKLAQALLESGNGNSYLAREANNHFGIKCGGVWQGKSVTHPDDHVRDCFRVYNDPEHSFRDHSQFLLRKRYEKLFTLDKNDYRGWAKGLKEAGYATNPRYPELLINLIERYQLYQYDRPEVSYVNKEQREEKIEEIIQEKEIEEPATATNTDEMKSAVAMVIYEVKTTDTLYNISQRHGVSIDQIKQLNGLVSEELSVGQLLVISK
ncbi:glucosaminidase domain-containing protein [Sphingobacterium sp. DN00404]|uniref:Peptidoglycan hydrolase n=1 Tax=Sphingobacterium micropteri TaxID=2763501 RepID=A0ABR7YPL8_9SPHI|nr:glucosaminidase domain-containing protein [Sphingobacterium micropteri]MBD1433283.1 glucosaminidase domain-containing protein [Sphingobacterium micropteri]